MRTSILHESILILALLSSVSLVLGAQESNGGGPWPADVAGFKAPEAGEHPRLFFRRSDLPALREKAQTVEGKAILARLKAALGGGEEMPQAKRPAGAPFGDKSAPMEQPDGAYSIGHAAGFGFLYQITGDKKYADLGRKCFEWAFEGVRDRDSKGRYGWKGDSGALRAGPSLGWYAVGYDLCYDGWDEDFRLKVAKAIENYNEGPNSSLEELVKGSRHMPASNHWGMQVGGGALAILAIMNDPGVDSARIKRLMDVSSKSMIRNMTEGFGDGGFFAEGDGTGSMSAQIVFLPALQAWKTAGGKDFMTPRANAQFMVLKWPILTVFRDGNPHFWPQRGGYPHNIWERSGLSGSGYFAYGFGILRDEYKPGMLWYYNRFLKDRDVKAGALGDTCSVYPQLSVLSFINWPVGLQEEEPEKKWPRAFRDSKWNFYAWRNRWRDADDTVISILTRASKGFMGANGETTLSIVSCGKDLTWGTINKGFTDTFSPSPDGSTVLNTGDGSGLAIDFSGASGADVMLVQSGPAAKGSGSLDAGGTAFRFLFLTKGAQPVPQVKGSTVVIGEQTVSVENNRIVLGKMASKK